MSVLSDKSIIKLCTPPSHRVVPSAMGSNPYMETKYVWESIDLPDVIEWCEAQGSIVRLTEEEVNAYNEESTPMINPFLPESVKVNEAGLPIASAGVSSYGYDIRAAAEFKVFRGFTDDGRIDYKNITEDMFETVHADSVWIPPGGFILARSVEYVHIPRDVLAIAIGKSTIARAGINCLVTPLEPLWSGYITLEFANTTNLPNKFYANEGVLQLVFLKGDEPCKTSYADRKGKYNNQEDRIILPRV